MEEPLLRDEKEYPTDDVLAQHLGKAIAAWDTFTSRLSAEFPDASLEWRYYNDGKSWLCKLVRKKKTVCWVSVRQRAFRTTFYFTAANDQKLDGLPIAQELKSAYAAQVTSGKLKPVTVVVNSQKQLRDVFTLIGYKCGAGRARR